MRSRHPDTQTQALNFLAIKLTACVCLHVRLVLFIVSWTFSGAWSDIISVGVTRHHGLVLSVFITNGKSVCICIIIAPYHTPLQLHSILFHCKISTEIVLFCPVSQHSPLVHVVLGVVQPHPDLHHVALAYEVEDVLHGVAVGCGGVGCAGSRCVTVTVCPGVAAQNWTALNTLTLLSAQTVDTVSHLAAREHLPLARRREGTVA